MRSERGRCRREQGHEDGGARIGQDLTRTVDFRSPCRLGSPRDWALDVLGSPGVFRGLLGSCVVQASVPEHGIRRARLLQTLELCGFGCGVLSIGSPCLRVLELLGANFRQQSQARHKAGAGGVGGGGSFSAS